MKRLLNVFGVTAAVILASLAIGCTTTKQRESLLSEAGFKMVPATTPQQQAHLKTLPPGKVTKVLRQGKTFYVYPDAAKNVMYVGQDAQYQKYEKLLWTHESSSPGLSDAQINNDPGWNGWDTAWGMWQ